MFFQVTRTQFFHYWNTNIVSITVAQILVARGVVEIITVEDLHLQFAGMYNYCNLRRILAFTILISRNYQCVPDIGDIGIY